MSKMTVIQLLNKIANGEELPKKIKWKDRTYKYVNEYKDYSYDNAYCFFEDDLLKTRRLLKHLNDEVEIIEEDKKINNLIYYNKKDFDNLDEFVEITTRDIFDKINEIIDKLNKGE